MTARDITTDDTSRTHDLGVLVVHGIGDQRQGATLTTWVDALAGWLETRSVDAKVLSADLRPTDGPARVDLHVDDPAGDTPQHWLFAEGWWANTFEPPSFGELWGWTFVSVPATAAMHANAMVTGAFRRLRTSFGGQRIYESVRLVATLVLLAVLVLISPLILGLFTALLVLGVVASFLPIDAVRTAVLKAQLISVGTIGDTKRLVDSPTQAGAIKRPVVDGVDWLRAQGCTRVVVLAHSQGAAVTYQALADIGAGLHGPTDPIDSFISVGSGLPKVHQLRFLTSPDGRHLRVASILVPIAAVATALSVRHLYLERALLGLGLMGAVMALTTLGIIALGITGSRRTRAIATRDHDSRAERERALESSRNRQRVRQAAAGLVGLIIAIVVALPLELSVVTLTAAAAIGTALASLAMLALVEIPPLDDALERSTMRWMDLWSSVDPVPAGPTRTVVPGRPESWRVTNLGSVLRDHNSYPLNRDECLSFIGNELCDIANPRRGDASASFRLTDNERRWRVGWRSFVAYMTMAAAAVFAWTTWRGADDAIRRLYARLRAPDGIVDRWYPGELPGFVPDAMSATAAEWVSVVGYLGIAVIAVQVAQAAWAAWNESASDHHLTMQATAGRETPSGDSVGSTQAAMVGLVVFAWFIAIVPRRVWRSWQALDLTSWRGLAVLAGAVASALLVGRLLPALLVWANVKRWAMLRDTSRIDGLVAYGDHQLTVLDDPHGALESLTTACDYAGTARHHNVHALAGRARALLAVAPLLRHGERNTLVGDLDPDASPFLADVYELEAREMYASACAHDHLVTPEIRLEYVRLLERLEAKAEAEAEIARQLRAANDQRQGDVPTLIALLAHDVEGGRLDAAWHVQLEDALSCADDKPLSPADELAARLALIVEGNESIELVEPTAPGPADETTHPSPHLEPTSMPASIEAAPIEAASIELASAEAASIEAAAIEPASIELASAEAASAEIQPVEHHRDRVDELLASDVRVEADVLDALLRHRAAGTDAQLLARRATATVDAVVDLTEPSEPRRPVHP